MPKNSNNAGKCRKIQLIQKKFIMSASLFRLVVTPRLTDFFLSKAEFLATLLATLHKKK
jgi:hypothetical protein